MSPRELRGRLRREDIGMGAWVLEAEDGTRWQLVGEVPRALVDQTVVVVGQEAALYGFAMTGPTLEVRRITPA